MEHLRMFKFITLLKNIDKVQYINQLHPFPLIFIQILNDVQGNETKAETWYLKLLTHTLWLDNILK